MTQKNLKEDPDPSEHENKKLGGGHRAIMGASRPFLGHAKIATDARKLNKTDSELKAWLQSDFI